MTMRATLPGSASSTPRHGPPIQSGPRYPPHPGAPLAHPVLLLAERPPKPIVVGTLAEHEALVARDPAAVADEVAALIQAKPAWVVIGEGAPLITDALDDAVRQLGAAG